MDVAGRFRSLAVIETLDRLTAQHGAPAVIRCDNGPEFIAHAVKSWATSCGADIAYTGPGKPWQNGSIESFSSRFRDEYLNMEWFSSRDEARILIEQWRRTYNEYRPHSALRYKTPGEFREAWQVRTGLASDVAA